jgi:hypothetical protein
MSTVIASEPDLKKPADADIFDTKPPVVELPEGLNLRNFLIGRQHAAGRINWMNAGERSESLVFEYAHPAIPKQVFRWTGWVGNIGSHQSQLPELVSGFNAANGFHLFSGTQIRSLDTGAVIPTIQDVPIAVRKHNPNSVLIGLIPKMEETPLLRQDLGVVMNVNQKAGFYSTLSDDQDLGIVMQPDVNNPSQRVDEIKESRRQCQRLVQKGWPATLIVFGGTPTKDSDLKLRSVEQEIVWWAEDARRNPDANINIILLKGSGGVADLYANNTEWLKANPKVKVVDLEAGKIKSALKELNLSSENALS